MPEVMTCSNVSWSSHETQTTALISMITSVCLYVLSKVNCMSQIQNDGWLKELECVCAPACMHACMRVCVCRCARAHMHSNIINIQVLLYVCRVVVHCIIILGLSLYT